MRQNILTLFAALLSTFSFAMEMDAPAIVLVSSEDQSQKFPLKEVELQKLVEIAPSLPGILADREADSQASCMLPVSLKGLFLLTRLAKNLSIVTMHGLLKPDEQQRLKMDAAFLGDETLFSKNLPMAPVAHKKPAFTAPKNCALAIKALDAIIARSSLRMEENQKSLAEEQEKYRRERNKSRVKKPNDLLRSGALEKIVKGNKKFYEEVIRLAKEGLYDLARQQLFIDELRENLRRAIVDKKDDSRVYNAITASINEVAHLTYMFNLLSPLISQTQVFLENRVPMQFTKTEGVKYVIDDELLSIEYLVEQRNLLVKQLSPGHKLMFMFKKEKEAYDLARKRVNMTTSDESFKALHTCFRRQLTMQHLLEEIEAHIASIAPVVQEFADVVDDTEEQFDEPPLESPPSTDDSQDPSATATAPALAPPVVDEKPIAKPAKFVPSWEQRRLDTISRLLNRQLLWNHKSPGATSVSTVLIDNQLHFLIATKNNVDKRSIISALQILIARADELSQTDLKGYQKYWLTTLNDKIKILTANSFHGDVLAATREITDLRINVDMGKFTKLINQSPTNRRFHADMASALRGENIIFVNNSAKCHPEMAIMEFFFELGDKRITPAYIGSHLLNCGCCHCLMFGRKKGKATIIGLAQGLAPVYSRGYFSGRYNGYIIPNICLTRNNISVRGMWSKLHANTTMLEDMSLFTKEEFLMKQADISESSDED